MVPLIMPPFLVPPFVVGIWLVVNRSLAAESGWTFLADRYGTTDHPDGAVIRGQVYRMGSVPEHNWTKLTVSPVGLHVSASLFARPFHPPFLVPWHVMTKSAEGRGWGWWGRHWVEVELDAITTIRVGPRAFQAMAPYIPSPDHAAA